MPEANLKAIAEFEAAFATGNQIIRKKIVNELFFIIVDMVILSFITQLFPMLQGNLQEDKPQEDKLQEDKLLEVDKLQEEEHRDHLVLLSHSQAVQHDRNLHLRISRGKLERLTPY